MHTMTAEEEERVLVQYHDFLRDAGVAVCCYVQTITAPSAPREHQHWQGSWQPYADGRGLIRAFRRWRTEERESTDEDEDTRGR